MSKLNRLIFISIIFTISVGIILNYTIKSPNDGTLYMAASDYFLLNGILIDPTRTFIGYLSKFPTTQIGLTFYLIGLKYLFGKLWLVSYCVVFATLWLVLIKRLYKFSKFNFSKNNNIYILFPFVIFLNYDYLQSSSSFYNELFYYPFLIFSFLKIMNCLKKEKSFYDKSVLFFIFLIFGSFLRVQHFVLLGSLLIFFMVFKKKKEFILTFAIILVNLSFFFLTLYLLNQVATSSLGTEIANQNELLHFLNNFFNTVFSSFETKLILKNIKVHLSLYSNFLNVPKLINFNLPNNGQTISELLYIFFSFSIIFFLIKSIKTNKLTKFKKFLTIYFVLTSIFLFMLTDYSSRYFLLINFCVTFFLFDALKINLKKIHFLSIAFLFSMVFVIYGYGYLKNLNQVKNTHNLHKLLYNFNNDRDNFYTKDDIFVSKYAYNIFWVTKNPSITLKNFFNDISKFKNKRYFFVGNLNELEVYKKYNNIKKIENYSNKENSNQFSIWRFYL